MYSLKMDRLFEVLIYPYLYLTVDLIVEGYFNFSPPLNFNVCVCVCVCVCVLKERGNYTGYRQSGAANWRTKRGNRVSTVDISAAMFSFGLINSRIRPQFARLGLLIFVQLIIKSAP